MKQANHETYIDVRDVSFRYEDGEDDASSVEALHRVDLEALRGQHVAILGRNGSGKSTLAKLINALEIPQSGVITVDGFDTRDDNYVWEIRRRCGMVFQNPDNQIVGTTVEEDAAFGPENLGVPSEEIRVRIDRALQEVGLAALATRQPSALSGGQKQKLAIAGILAMEPACMILDEATAMLDPVTRRDLMDLIHRLQAERHLIILQVTHHMEEVARADRVLVLDRGHAILQGTPAEVFARVAVIHGLGLEVPFATALADAWARTLGISMPTKVAEHPDHAKTFILEHLREAGTGSCSEELSVRASAANGANRAREPEATPSDSRADGQVSTGRGITPPDDASPEYERVLPRDRVIEVRDLSHTYDAGDPLAVEALRHIHFNVRRGEVLGVIGSSGSGKSTLIQHLNALLRPQTGEVRILGHDTADKTKLSTIRAAVGLLFQYPEHQLFAETVYADVAFGPRQQKVPEAAIQERVHEALEIVGLGDLDTSRSPFELSGGQMRRVALAGILAMRPEILILDEPAAGLDPAGREEILSYLVRLRDRGVTVVLVSHSMDDVARYADRLLVLHEGEQIAWGDKAAVFADAEALEQVQLELPSAMRFMAELEAERPGLTHYRPYYTLEDACRGLCRYAGIPVENLTIGGDA